MPSTGIVGGADEVCGQCGGGFCTLDRLAAPW